MSSLYRLFFVLTDTTVETIRPDWGIGLQAQPIPPVSAAPPMAHDSWERRLDDLTRRPTSRGTIEYLVDGEAFFTRFIDAVSSAEESVHIRMYIFDNDDYATQIGEFLKRRSKEDIDVKIMLDGIGTLTAALENPDSLPTDYQPPASVVRFLESGSEINVRQLSNPFLTGDHTKTITIDRRYAFAGGMNIGREYRYDWHDLMMEIHGPVVDILQEEFDDTWAHAGPLGDVGYLFHQLRPRRSHVETIGYPVRVLFTRPGVSEIFIAQREAIRRASNHIYVQNAYFTDDTLLQELVKARRRGVDVRVIIPLETDRGPITRDNALAANVMLKNGIRVYIYPGFSHVKAAIFDGWACVGSANLDRLSLKINRELNLATSDPEPVQALMDQVFLPDFERSPELTEPFPERWVDHLVEIVGDYLF